MTKNEAIDLFMEGVRRDAERKAKETAHLNLMQDYDSPYVLEHDNVPGEPKG